LEQEKTESYDPSDISGSIFLFL